MGIGGYSTISEEWLLVIEAVGSFKEMEREMERETEAGTVLELDVGTEMASVIFGEPEFESLVAVIDGGSSDFSLASKSSTAVWLSSGFGICCAEKSERADEDGVTVFL